MANFGFLYMVTSIADIRLSGVIYTVSKLGGGKSCPSLSCHDVNAYTIIIKATCCTLCAVGRLSCLHTLTINNLNNKKE